MQDPAHRELRAADLDAVREQIGREPTTPFTVVARCTGGHPLVIRNAPFDAGGEPFPTTYWLTCPEAVKARPGAYTSPFPGCATVAVYAQSRTFCVKRAS